MIYYIRYSGSLYLLGIGCEPMTLTTEGQGITNMTGKIYHYAILLLL